jgi:hypothetical protein
MPILSLDNSSGVENTCVPFVVRGADQELDARDWSSAVLSVVRSAGV